MCFGQARAPPIPVGVGEAGLARGRQASDQCLDHHAVGLRGQCRTSAWRHSEAKASADQALDRSGLRSFLRHHGGDIDRKKERLIAAQLAYHGCDLGKGGRSLGPADASLAIQEHQRASDGARCRRSCLTVSQTGSSDSRENS